MNVLLAHPGTQHSFKLAAELDRRNLLAEFWTCFAFREKSLRAKFLQFGPRSVRERLENRLVDLPPLKLRTQPRLEQQARRQLARGIEPERAMLERNEQFQELIPEETIKEADIVIGFDTSSWLLIDKAHRAGKPFVLDQSIGHPRASQEAAQRASTDFPEWSQSFQPTMQMLLESQTYEHAQADLIVVASAFTRDTLIANGVAQSKIRVNPYGVDLKRFHSASTSDSQRVFRFIFVGGLTARKGIPVLLSAWKKLQRNDAELWLVGDVSESIRPLIPDLPGLKILGRKFRGQLPELLRSCDVFVFPSYFEGFGLVLLEAMASGLPIIATEATAAPDLIGDTNAGKLIKSGDVDQLIAAMTHFIDHRDEVQRLSKAARVRAEEFSWTSYGDRWGRILSELTTDYRPQTSDL